MAKKPFLGFIYDQFRKVPPLAKGDLKGKTVIVVGANTGIGFEATQHFARMDPGRLILACRNKEKGEAAVQRIQEATSSSTAELWIMDLAEFSSVKTFVDRAMKELARLDILLLNAAVSPGLNTTYRATKDEWEQTLQVNDLSSSLLALLLLPRLLDTAKQLDTVPRIVIVSSEGHFWSSFEEKVFQSPNAFDLLGSKEYCTPRIMKNRYFDTKLLNVFFTRALNNRLKNQPIVVNTVNPGFCSSELVRDLPSVLSVVFRFGQWLLAHSAEEGSRQFVWAAIGAPGEDDRSLEDMKGAYVHQSRIDEPSDFVLGEQGKKWEDKLWTDLIAVLEKVDPRVKDVVVQYLT